MRKFVVLEGLDGSGKSTQIEKLKAYFDKENICYKYLHFPQTDDLFFGELISKFLRGEFGNIDQVDPYIVAMLYAGDRHTMKDQIMDWINIDSVVLIDRYVLSNIAFQCAKIDNVEDKERLMNWIYKLEYEHFKIPRPQLSIFLDVPISFVENNLKNQRSGADRDYLKGKEDIHEQKIEFQERVRQEYINAVNLDEKAVVLNCTEGNNMKSADEIFNLILNQLKVNKII